VYHGLSAACTSQAPLCLSPDRHWGCGLTAPVYAPSHAPLVHPGDPPAGRTISRAPPRRPPRAHPWCTRLPLLLASLPSPPSTSSLPTGHTPTAACSPVHPGHLRCTQGSRRCTSGSSLWCSKGSPARAHPAVYQGYPPQGHQQRLEPQPAVISSLPAVVGTLCSPLPRAVTGGPGTVTGGPCTVTHPVVFPEHYQPRPGCPGRLRSSRAGGILGSGHFGTVRRCFRKGTGQQYAVKSIDKARRGAYNVVCRSCATRCL